MNPETIRNAIRFLERVSLNGNEVPAYNQVMQTMIGLLQTAEAQAAEAQAAEAPVDMKTEE